jgi:hypothetical protein
VLNKEESMCRCTISRLALLLLCYVGLPKIKALKTPTITPRGDRGWSGTPMERIKVDTKRTAIKNPRRGERVEGPGGEGLVEEAARYAADVDSLENNDLSILFAMSTQHHNDNASQQHIDRSSSQHSNRNHRSAFGLRAISRAEKVTQRPIYGKAEDIEANQDELRRMAALTGSTKDIADQGDVPGSDVSSAHAVDAAPPDNIRPQAMTSVELLRRENNFLRRQMQQLAQPDERHSAAYSFAHDESAWEGESEAAEGGRRKMATMASDSGHSRGPCGQLGAWQDIQRAAEQLSHKRRRSDSSCSQQPTCSPLSSAGSSAKRE